MLYLTSGFFAGLQLCEEAPAKRADSTSVPVMLCWPVHMHCVDTHTLLRTSTALSHSQWNVNPPHHWRKCSIRPEDRVSSGEGKRLGGAHWRTEQKCYFLYCLTVEASNFGRQRKKKRFLWASKEFRNCKEHDVGGGRGTSLGHFHVFYLKSLCSPVFTWSREPIWRQCSPCRVSNHIRPLTSRYHSIFLVWPSSPE